ncbi:hypothetical protein [Paenibacillus ihuae]|uniref:hypothetical protein n=1 Tax=Paenibacillus ihuae TaxID=1232431 RepID=UPI0006D5B027|nr:hypothetical protein [Paenibacillus ihuae]
MLKRIILLILSSISLFSTVSCSQETSIDIDDAVTKSEKYFRQLDEIATTASSYDGKKDLKFRLMVEGNPTETEATIFFNLILDVVTNYSNLSDVWNFYNGYFDITNYDQGVIYEGTKLIGEDLIVQTK